MPKDRGIAHVERYFGDFIKLVSDKVKKSKKKIKILDAGCGYGVAMMGFVKRFGDKMEIIGFNYSKHDGDTKIMKNKAIEKGIFTKKELSKIKNLPKFVYCDASKKLPFKDNSFDFIYSMASIYLYDNKIHFLEECNRILKKNGFARISPSFGPHKTAHVKNRWTVKLPEKYWDFWEIWDKGKEVKIWNYCKKIKGVRAVWKDRGKGNKPMYIEIKGSPKVDFKLRFVSSVDINFLYTKWGGVKSIYSTQLEKSFIPRYKK